LRLDSTLVAAAGTPVRIVIMGRDAANPADVRLRIDIKAFNPNDIGAIPIRLDQPIVDHIAPGTVLTGTTLGAISLVDGRARLAIPIPFVLSTDPPNGAYTPSPLRTVAPPQPRHRPSPSPTPSPAASATPAPPSATP
jgi:hypothetical protein